MKKAKTLPPPHAFVVDVARTPEGAYNPNRPISGLIESQIRRLHEPERRLPRRHHSGVDVGMIKTEAQAAAYIAHVTAAIHAHARASAKKTTLRGRTQMKQMKKMKKRTKTRKNTAAKGTRARRTAPRRRR
jgi:hypothetical protein